MLFVQIHKCDFKINTICVLHIEIIEQMCDNLREAEEIAHYMSFNSPF